jgi:hypothetical protein
MISEPHHETPLEIVATLTTCGPFGRAGSENSRPFTIPLPWRRRFGPDLGRSGGVVATGPRTLFLVTGAPRSASTKRDLSGWRDASPSTSSEP